MKKGLKIFLIIIGLILMMTVSGVVGGLICKESINKKNDETIKENNNNNKEETQEDNTKIIQQRYEEAYKLMYEEFMPAYTEMQDMEANELTFKGRKINKEKLSDYFTTPKLDVMLEKYGEITFNGERYVTSLDVEDFYPDTEYDPNRSFDPGTIFSETDSGIRKLKVLSASENYVLAQAEVETTELDSSFGGEYIIFIKENEKWKIDFYQ